MATYQNGNVVSPPQMTMSQPPPQFTMWSYIGPDGCAHGPFHGADMIKWTQASYFTDSLLVRTDNDDKFYPLADWKRLLGGQLPFNLPIHSFQALTQALAQQQQQQQQQTAVAQAQVQLPTVLPTAFGPPAAVSHGPVPHPVNHLPPIHPFQSPAPQHHDIGTQTEPPPTQCTQETQTIPLLIPSGNAERVLSELLRQQVVIRD
ncbi:hypothetical protein WR25_08991 isoform A [Diploscapter pachys]|uniref:GYF domain-containing protein n=2 Tax=Diploscapter pachys TaxID=2018661 RepID=A0A2A2M1Q1_9BILA|nr:hypothetical protein WR25_08991 isoform A [Diploscapter pachys]